MISMVFLCSFNVGHINPSKLFCADDIVLSNKKLYDFDNGEFLEGSNKVNSPYFGENANDKWYYLEPGNYYVAKNKMVVNILTREENVIPNMKKAKYLINDFENDSQLTKASNSSSFNKINNAYYFENLKQFSSNLDGACGIVALSILLGYYDNFYDDLFIPNNLTYDSNQVVAYGSVPFEKDRDYNLEDVTSMPGTTQAFYDYLLEKYGNTILGLEPGDFGLVTGYPMDANSIYQTITAYIDDNASKIKNNIIYDYGSLFYTHTTPKEILNQNIPVALVLINYTFESVNNAANRTASSAVNGLDNTHGVVAYGYSDDMFLVHTGSHNHSASINIFNGDGKDEKICTCGYIFTHEHTLIYEKNNSSSHLVKCSVCNEVIGTEVHKFVFNIKLDTNVCSRCGYIGSKIEEIIHGRKI